MAIALTFSRYGPPDVLVPTEIGDEQPGPGQVRVRVKAAGVQPFDCVIRRGDLAQWVPVQLPSRLGNEFAGVIDLVGDGVRDVTAGDAVLGWAVMASYAETVIVDTGQLVSKPPDMPWPEAAVLSASGQTAHTALRELAVGPRDTLLVHAAAGGVGTFAVQIARAWGATVIGTASQRNHEYLRTLGAIPVSYGPGLEERVRQLAPRGVTAALDAIGGEALEVSVRLVADRTRIGTTTDRASAGRLGVRVMSTLRSSSRLLELADLYSSGHLQIPIWKSFPLTSGPAAHREVETGHVRGKVVLEV